jgi:hypothetical protein
MPHAPPRAPSRGGGDDDNDSPQLKAVLLADKTGDLVLPAPALPDRGMFGEPAMEPAQTVFRRGQDYQSSLSDTSEESSSSHSCLDDDELESPTAAAAAAAMADAETGVDIDDVDDGELFDCLEGCELDNFEIIDGVETDGLEPATEGKPRGAIAVVVSYIFVGKPKMVDISHSPRSSGDSRRWGLPPPSRPSTIQEIPNEPEPSPEPRLPAPAPAPTPTLNRPTPAPPLLTTTTTIKSEPHFLAQPHPTTTTCYSDNPTPAKSTSWRGLVRSVSRRRKRTPKDPINEPPPPPLDSPTTEEPAMTAVEFITATTVAKPQRRPRSLGVKLQKTSRLPGGSPARITA